MAATTLKRPFDLVLEAVSRDPYSEGELSEFPTLSEDGALPAGHFVVTCGDDVLHINVVLSPTQRRIVVGFRGEGIRDGGFNVDEDNSKLLSVVGQTRLVTPYTNDTFLSDRITRGYRHVADLDDLYAKGFIDVEEHSRLLGISVYPLSAPVGDYCDIGGFKCTVYVYAITLFDIVFGTLGCTKANITLAGHGDSNQTAQLYDIAYRAESTANIVTAVEAMLERPTELTEFNGSLSLLNPNKSSPLLGNPETVKALVFYSVRVFSANQTTRTVHVMDPRSRYSDEYTTVKYIFVPIAMDDFLIGDDCPTLFDDDIQTDMYRNDGHDFGELRRHALLGYSLAEFTDKDDDWY